MYDVPFSHYSLEEYWDYMQIPESYGYGIRNGPDAVAMGVNWRTYWQQHDRHWLGLAIHKSEERLKKDSWLGFPIRREYNDGRTTTRELPWAWPLSLNKYVRGVGVEASTCLVDGKAIVYGADPIELTVAVTFTDVDELLIYYPGQRKYTIRPSEVTISGGTATIKIPKVRLLKPEYFKDYDNVNNRPDYEDDSYFLETVDIVRNYLDTTTGCNLVWNRQVIQTMDCCLSYMGGACEPSGACEQELQAACATVTDQRNGVVLVEPATYSAGSWSKASYAVKRQPDQVQINYMRGRYDRYDEIAYDIQRAIIAVAHNNFPQDPCLGSALQANYYERDIKPIEPPVNLRLGPSTWGIFEAAQIIREFDADTNAFHGGML